MRLHCDVHLTASKSESNRVLMIAAYGGFEPCFKNLSDSTDTRILDGALRRLSSIGSYKDDKEDNPCIIDIADCGTAARFMATYLACHEGEWLLTGTERMCKRPMVPLVDALRTLGANIQYVVNKGCLPLLIKGNQILGGKTSVDMTQSSQYASSMLLAAPMFPLGLELELVGEPSSWPYLDMTLDIMCHFFAQVKRQGRMVIVQPKPYRQLDFTIEPDWTAASYWYEMAAFSEECEIRLHGLSLPSLQGDSVIAEWMKPLGVGTFFENDAIVLRKIPFKKQSLCFDFSQHPDLYPTMAAVCAGWNVEATFTGLHNLVFKESDRVEAMHLELSRLNDRPVRFCAHDDHRIVMALAPLSMLVGPVSFDHPEVVMKSYPNYWEEASFLKV